MWVAEELGSYRAGGRSRSGRQAVRCTMWDHHSVLTGADHSGEDMRLPDSLQYSEKGKMAALEAQDRSEQSGS
jgi:hypothetical protein